jgi:hypothetical protein
MARALRAGGGCYRGSLHAPPFAADALRDVREIVCGISMSSPRALMGQ